jgi:Tfp pilus assembly protein PilN
VIGLDALLTTRPFATPSLIPPVIKRRRAVGDAKRRVGIALLLLAAIVAVFFVIGRLGLVSARTQLATAQAGLRAAQAEQMKYSEVPAVYAAVDAARAELSQAMGNEVQVARLLSDLGVIIPPDVALTSVSMVTGGDALEALAEDAPAAEEQILVGTADFSGEAVSFNDVSAWIDTLRAQPDYQNVLLTEVSRDDTTGMYTFSSSAQLTDQALSGRFVRADQ